ncbi:MAG: hypothetical protein NZ700_08255, partial [Gemmataceae bacterium]|nr:hypothetical protein [Gemmataceae bacterium]MDW8265948.1 hypothetical protein [Gemmataceae bacterium]
GAGGRPPGVWGAGGAPLPRWRAGGPDPGGGRGAGGGHAPPPPGILDQLRSGLAETTGPAAADETLRLVEAIRVLALRHGGPAIRHCIRLVEETRRLADALTQSDGD